QNIVEINEYAVSVQNPSFHLSQKKMFTFDSVYNMMTKTEVIYNDMCYSLVESTVEGYNATIFAYGQTGCGKTYTMQGDGNISGGIIPKCFDHIFESISMASNVKYLALVSYLEIYNESIRDLLTANESLSMINHPLKEIPGLGVIVPTLTTQPVTNANQCNDCLKFGNKKRITASTLMNENSSRSHTIFTITLEQSPSLTSEEVIGEIRRGKLNLVDLAGSERQRKTGAQGQRLREATNINLSLSALGNVISSLVDGKTKHVPFRDSKLTRLLQDSLGGNTKTLMISCISSSDMNYDETISTLRYASRAKNISNKPTINEDPKDAQLRQYKNEILNLKKMLEENEQQFSYKQIEGTKLLGLSVDKFDIQSQSKIRDNEPIQFNSEMKSLSKTNISPINALVPSVEYKGDIQFHAKHRIDFIKRTLIGGERINDLKLKEQHNARKKAAQRHLSAIANAISRVKCADRDLLQDHYASIAQELTVKNGHIRICHQKIKTLEMEVSDLNSEFQLDREDFLDEIRSLGKQIKFYQQFFYKFQTIFRRNGISPELFIKSSSWNDDLKIWKIPEIDTLKLPPANLKS
ncbi:hypothetical protein KR009_008140, partial [Drosophila setifemur]